MSDALANPPPISEDGAVWGREQAPSGRRRDRTAAGWCAIALFWIAALGSIGLAASNFRRVALAADHVEELCRLAPANQVGRGACAVFARTQPPVMFDPDSECWIDLTQKQYRDGTIRPHDDPFDNAPYGRERQWSSSFSWWLLLLAGLAHVFGGAAVEQRLPRSRRGRTRCCLPVLSPRWPSCCDVGSAVGPPACLS